MHVTPILTVTDKLLQGCNLRENVILPHIKTSVQVDPQNTSSVITHEHPLRVKHRHNLENNSVLLKLFKYLR